MSSPWRFEVERFRRLFLLDSYISSFVFFFLQSMSGETGASGEGDDQPMAEGEDEDMDVLMQNPDFIRSVLSSLPGVNPEEAIQNLEQMEEMEKKEKEVG